MKESSHPAFVLEVRLERAKDAPFYFIKIPVAVSRAIGRRGNVPIIAKVNGVAEVRASLVPTGGGRHRLQLNARVRERLGAEPGDRLRIELRVDANPTADPSPRDLAQALREHDVTDAFGRLPVGKRNHIIQWIEAAVADATREKRIVATVEVALRAAEKEHDRARVAGKGGRGRRGSYIRIALV